MPCVERPPRTPSTIRQGQMASQLHDSRYAPEIRQSTPLLNHRGGYDASVSTQRPNPEQPSLNPLDKARDVGAGVVHPVETTKDLAAEADRGVTARTPLIATTAVTIVVGIAVAILLAVALVLYFTLGGGKNH